VTALLVAVWFWLVVFLHAVTGFWALFLMLPAIFAAAILFDRGSGFLATALSTALLVIGVNQAAETFQQYWLPLLFFVLVGIAVATVSETLRKGWERAVTAERATTLLYRELSHRTKNDFAMASAVLRMQARAHRNPEVQEGLMAAAERLQVLSQAHEQFAPTPQGQQVEMCEFLQKVCDILKASIGADAPVELNLQCDELRMPATRAIPIGLMTNEFVMNAYKHAFPEGMAGTIRVALRAEESLKLSVEDDGKGCPEDAVEHVGSQLTELFVRQLGGTLRRERLTKGCRVSVTLPAS
jgi:two-component sensor histidine kinase